MLASVQEPPAQPPGRRPAPTVLVVDDEPEILSSLKLFLSLEDPPLRIVTASRAEEALAMLEREQVDAVLSDLRMPGMDGLRLLAEVRRRRPQAKRMLMTAYHEYGMDERAVAEAAPACVLKKPFLSVELLAMMKDVGR